MNYTIKSRKRDSNINKYKCSSRETQLEVENKNYFVLVSCVLNLR